MNGITSYASRAKAQVVGKMKRLMSSEASSTPEEEIDKFGAAYESGVNTKKMCIRDRRYPVPLRFCLILSVLNPFHHIQFYSRHL